MYHRLFAALVALSTILSCTTQDETAPIKSIGTDLPDRFPENTVHLYWIHGDEIYRGECIDDEVGGVIRPSLCEDNLATMPYSDFRTALDGGLHDTIRELQEESRRIRQMMTYLEREIESLLELIQELEDSGAETSQELRAAREKLARFQVGVRELRLQLELIEAELDRLADGDLASQRELILGQLAQYRSLIRETESQIERLLESLRGIRDELAELHERLARLNNRMENLQLDLAGVLLELNSAYEDLAVYEDTLRKLESNIIYHVVSENTWYRENRQFVKRFEAIFERL